MDLALEYSTTRQMSARLGLSEKQVRALARAGRLRGAKVGRRWLFKNDLARSESRSEAGPSSASDGGIYSDTALRGTVTALAFADGRAEIVVRVEGQELLCSMPEQSAERLALRVGETVLALLDPIELRLAHDPARG